MDFFFDNIVFFAVVAYMLIVFVSKVAMTGGGGGDNAQTPSRRPRGHSAHDFPRSATRPTPRSVPARKPAEKTVFETESPAEEPEISDAQKRRELANDARYNAEPGHSPTAPCNRYAPEAEQSAPPVPQEPEDFGEMFDPAAARRLVEQMTADSHGFHGGNSYINADLFELENFAEEDAESASESEPVRTAELSQSQAASAEQSLSAAEKYALDSAGALRRAFVAAEILGKPKSLKSDETW